MDDVTISNIGLYEEVVVCDIKTNHIVKNRMASMGLVPGCIVAVVSRAVLGSSIVIEFGSDLGKTRIALSKKESDLIIVTLRE